VRARHNPAAVHLRATTAASESPLAGLTTLRKFDSRVQQMREERLRKPASSERAVGAL
jgi:hypothetical protein